MNDQDHDAPLPNLPPNLPPADPAATTPTTPTAPAPPSTFGPPAVDVPAPVPSVATPMAPEPWSTDQRLDPAWLTTTRLGSFIVVGILTMISIPTAGVLLFVTEFGRYLLPPLMLLLGLLTWRAWWWPGVRYSHIAYRLDAHSLVIQRGVLWRSVIHVPRSRVQHTDVSQGPIERHFEIGTLIVHTAGTQHASVALPGLAYDTAVAMRDALIDGGDDDGV